MTQTDEAGTHQTAPVLDLDRYIPYLINQVANRMNRVMGAMIKPLDTSIPKWRIVATLVEGGPMRMGTLSEHTVIEQSTLSRVIDQMERDGQVERLPLEGNNRVIEVHLTSKGQELYREVQPIAVRLGDQITKEFTEVELGTQVRFLHRMIENLEPKPPI